MKRHMPSLLLAGLLSLAILPELHAQQRGDPLSSAVDTKGVRQRVTLDMTTGSVSKVAMVQSTGVAALDNSAMKALRQWQWKPGKWKEIDVPITFAMSPPSRR